MESKFNKNYQVYRKYLNQIVIMYQQRNDIRLFLETLLTMSAVVFFGLFAVKPTLVTVAELYRGKQAKEQTLATLNGKIDNLVAAEKLYNQYTNEITLLHDAIPSRPQVESVVRQIEGAANRNGAQLLAFSLDEVVIKGHEVVPNAEGTTEETTPSVNEITFDLSATGDYNQLIAFLRDLESLRRPINFQELDFRKPVTTETLTLLVLNIKGTVAYLPQNE